MIRAMWAVLWLACFVGTASADNWPAWRGPHFTGVAQGTGYPVNWSGTENVAWKIALPGLGGSTPAVWGDAIFVTCGDEGQNAVLCYNGAGELQWKTHLGKERPGKHRKATGSNPSPTTDGERVYVYFKSGDLACLDFAGKILWQKNLQQLYGEDTLWWDLGTSPLLTQKLLVVACVQSGPSYLAGFDKMTGDEVWKVDRMLDAPNESNQTYSTPIPVQIDGRDAFVVLGADHVTAHDTATGQEIWRVGGLNPTQQGFFRSIASPVVLDGIAVAPYARGKSLTAIRIEGQGDITQSHVAWFTEETGSDVPTPAALDGRLYLCTDRGEVSCREIKSGRELWRAQCERSGNTAYSASPIIADGKLYCTREDGVVTVLAIADGKILSTNPLGDFVVATPVFVNGRILLRTSEHLYCIGQ